MVSIERLRVKGKSGLETFLCSSHGLAFQPDDFKLARGAHMVDGIGLGHKGTAYNQ